MDIDIKSGPAIVISSGSVFSFGKNPIIMEFYGFKLILQFEDEKDDKGNPKENFSKKLEVIDKQTLKFTFINFINSLGIGTIDPFQIGNFQNKALYFNYTIYGSPTRSSKNVQYTLFLLEEPGGNLSQMMNTEVEKK